MQDRNINSALTLLMGFCFLFINQPLSSQTIADQIMTEEYFQNIEESPVEFTAENVIVRFIDGLGFRYYWATKDLQEKDFDYRPSIDGRSMRETMIHVYHLSSTIRNASENAENGSRKDPTINMDSLRYKTLQNLEAASRNFLNLEVGEGEEMKLIFVRGENRSEFEIWNLFNGPIADAIWHTGQIVSFRRSAGNPLPSGVNVFRGIRKE